MNNNNTNKKNRRKSGAGIIALLVIILIEIASEMDEDIVFIAVIGVVALAVFFIIVKALSKKMKSKASGSVTALGEHTHNSLDKENCKGNESARDHYVKQLDSFLDAGIIDKNEYRTMLARYIERRY